MVRRTLDTKLLFKYLSRLLFPLKTGQRDIMRYLLIIIILSVKTALFCQENSVKTLEIAAMEQASHQRLINGPRQTFASTNFDVKHYRCEWTVDPSIRYIAGKVTPFFQVTSSTNSITFDLMDDLTVDSVRQRGVLLSFSHLSDVLQVTLTSMIQKDN
jgi:hypothetical protein